MSNIDERIVQMKFNNGQFESGVKTTMKSLDDLKGGLNFDAAKKGLGDLQDAGKRFSLDGIGHGVEVVSAKFLALATIGITALSNIVNKAMTAGLAIAKSLTIDPVKAGLAEYELKMGSIQTILANTARHGTGLPQVVGALDELNEYADKTIYNFGDMTKNIGLFTNAGLKVEDATSMIKGFSNEAAASGTTSQGAAGAAYQLSQALSAGTIRLMDWRSLTNVGMGNKNMQNGLIEIADAMGTLTKNSTSATEIQDNFNGSLEKNWLSADVMSAYLKIMAGDMTAAEQAALGLSDAQVAAFAKSQVTAEEAATKVRTWTQLIGTMQEGVGSGWAQTFDILIGDFNEATDMWTAVNDRLGPMIGAMADERNKLLSNWKAIGGRDEAIQAVKNAFDALMGILTPVKEAFREIFPPTTGVQLLIITKNIRKFTEALKPSEQTVENIKRTFKGFFALLDIGWMIMKQVFGLFGNLLGPVSKAGGGILGFTAKIGDLLVHIRDAIKNGEGLTKVFGALGNILGAPIAGIKILGEWLAGTINIQSFAEGWEKVMEVLRKVREFLKPVGDWFVSVFKTIKDIIAEGFSQLDFNSAMGGLTLVAGGGLFVALTSIFNKIKGLFSGGGDGLGLIKTIKGTFGALTDTLGAMQEKVKSEAIKNIAIALLILVASVAILSLLDTDKMYASVGAMGILFAELAAMMKALELATKTIGSKKLVGLAAALILLSTAMLIMAAAVSVMAKLDWNELARGLAGMAVGLGIFVVATKLLGAKEVVGLTATAFGIMLMSAAMLVMAGALKAFATMSWEELARGVAAFAGTITVLVAVSHLMGKLKNIAVGAAGLLIMSVAMSALAGSLKIFASMSWEELAVGLTAMAGALAILAIAMMIMPGDAQLVLAAGGLLIMAVALTIMAGALKILGTMSWEEVAKSLVMLAGSLLIIAGAMYLMTAAIPGALALVVVAAGLWLLVPLLMLLGNMSWDQIGTGLGALAAMLGIVAAAGILLILALPGLLGLGLAALMIGNATLAAGIGVGMLAIGLVALAAAGAAGAIALKAALLIMIGLIPEAMAAFAQGIIDFALVIANGGVEFTAAMTTLLTSLITAIGTVGPQIIDTLWDLLMQMVDKLEENIPKLVESGMKMIVGILEGIGNNIQDLVEAGADVIIEFLNGVSNKLPEILEAAADVIVSFVDGLGDAVANNSDKFITAGRKLFRAIVDGVSKAIEQGGKDIRWAGERIGNALLNGAKNALGINSPSKEFHKIGEGSTEGLINGLEATGKAAAKAGGKLGIHALTGVKKSMADVAKAVAMDMDMTPTIRPVLDLSAIKKDAGLVNGMLGTPKLALDKTYLQASTLAAVERAQSEQDTDSDESVDNTTNNSVTFIQNNTSPKSLSNAEIYRQTNNQLSVVKGALTT